MGLFEKRRCAKFFKFCDEFVEDNPTTHKGLDKDKTMKKLFEDYSLEKQTQDFTGHAMALYREDS